MINMFLNVYFFKFGNKIYFTSLPICRNAHQSRLSSHQVIKKWQAHILSVIVERRVRLWIFSVLLASSNLWHAQCNSN